ncbi:flavin reductase family protein [Marinobacterium sediminicola]|uniref:NADH-FMN oxidoreductase RutF, flavin reductase (DIM6/NTAB) family n=1 Tax=Marinobacterium sediminicola TaxID=518898 RepID=A0ABY1S3N8_9GAMM|nr:flavin reductase family protein [Marinobacterium sediminicola]ULG68264.1 flavin reductase family protein [Marinobacterium sediminicola]SMR77766.1 NADH-FMN oxidoreductase RutF, flavin reductase (DIM6/NTAB) family [Marinobacterium sediminicola]
MTSVNTANVAVEKGSTAASLAPAIDPRELRDALGLFATGVTVVTAPGNGEQPVGITANSFSSLSLEPPLVLWSLAMRSPNLDAFEEGKPFAINILQRDQEALALQFARPMEDKFHNVEYELNNRQVPLLQGAQAQLECTVEFTRVLGDHLLIVGRVEAMQTEPSEPLLFYRGAFAQLVG